MSATLSAYWKTAKAEEIAGQLREEGYDVEVGGYYDVVARKPGHRIAVEVALQSELKEKGALLSHLRQEAIERGYDEFRLVMTHLPQQTSINVQDLPDQLLLAFSQNPALLGVSTELTPGFLAIRDLEIKQAELLSGHTRLTGEALLLIEWPAESHFQNEKWMESLAFEFDVELDANLFIQRIHAMRLLEKSVLN